jgi:hypothetical protein
VGNKSDLRYGIKMVGYRTYLALNHETKKVDFVDKIEDALLYRNKEFADILCKSSNKILSRAKFEVCTVLNPELLKNRRQ